MKSNPCVSAALYSRQTQGPLLITNWACVSQSSRRYWLGSENLGDLINCGDTYLMLECVFQSDRCVS